MIISINKLCAAAVTIVFLITAAHAQVYTLEQTAIAGGGIAGGTGGSFTLNSTTGQAAVGNALRGDSFSMSVGFWNYSPLAPTAAGADIAGRVLTTAGQGIRNAQMILINSSGERCFAQTGSFGYFRFENVPVGETYVLSVRSKRFELAEPSRVIPLSEDLRDVNFISEPE